jgi:hypothetical protein
MVALERDPAQLVPQPEREDDLGAGGEERHDPHPEIMPREVPLRE